MTSHKWNPGNLLETSGYYWQSCTLHAGVKLDIFSLIGGQTLPAESIAEKLNSETRGVTVLLNALTAMGLLQKTGDTYSNTPESRKFLDSSSPAYIGYMIKHHHYLVESWARIDDAILTGKPTRSRSSFSDDDRRESFLMGMFNSAMASAPTIAELVDLSNCSHLLDLGGGPGTYAVHFCLQNEGLQANVFDLPPTRPFAEKIIHRFQLDHRITFCEGDYIEDSDLGGEKFDAVWMSHILHGEGPEAAEKMIEKAVNVLSPGGKILIHEFLLNDTMDGPLFPALFSINMLVGNEGGRSYSENQLREMLSRQGICDITRLNFSGPSESGILEGYKPV